MEETSQLIEQRKEIIRYLNEKAETRYRETSAKTSKLINTRQKEGFTVDDFKAVIDCKVAQWKKCDRMRKYLRPETLFGSKFESYLNDPDILKNTKEKEAISYLQGLLGESC